MNFKRERVTRGTRPELDEDQLNYFRTGVDYCFFWDEPERGQDWRGVKKELLPDWIAERPGTRPFAW